MRRVWFHRQFVKENRQSRVHGWLSQLVYRKTSYRSPSYRNTTTATRIPKIKTEIASRLTWFASHDSCTGTAFARKAGTNSSSFCAGAVKAADSEAVLAGAAACSCSPCSIRCCSCARCFFSKSFFSRTFLSQSRHSVLPSETGNPQESHFCTRSMASGTGAGVVTGDITKDEDEIPGGSAGAIEASANSGLTGVLMGMLTGMSRGTLTGFAAACGALLAVEISGKSPGTSSGEVSAKGSGETSDKSSG